MVHSLAIFAVVHSAMAASAGTCSEHVPVTGEALLQHHAAREQTHKEKVHIDSHVKVAPRKHEASGSLPDQIYRFLNDRLCDRNHHVQESILQTSGAQGGGLLKTASHIIDQKMGKNAALNEFGYEGVVRSGNEEEVKTFIRRLAQSCDLEVSNEGGLNGVAPWFTGANTTETTFDKLKMSLYASMLSSSSEQWVAYKGDSSVTGQSAPTNVLGYVQVRALKDAEETTTFVRRLIRSMGIKIVDENGFEGMMSFYSDPYEYQSYFDLTKDIKKAANAHTLSGQPASWAAME